jgi:hypothetical protein
MVTIKRRIKVMPDIGTGEDGVVCGFFLLKESAMASMGKKTMSLPKMIARLTAILYDTVFVAEPSKELPFPLAAELNV